MKECWTDQNLACMWGVGDCCHCCLEEGPAGWVSMAVQESVRLNNL